MTKEELAAQYSELKIEELTRLIEESYLKGYERGCIDSSNHINIDGVEYVDLGLPSGTLWSEEPLYYCEYGYHQKRLSYQEAIQLPIPNEEQWEEVLRFCLFLETKIIGPSGQRIGYGWAPARYRIYNLGENCEEDHNLFWLKGEVDSEIKAPVMLYDFKKIDDEIQIVKGSSRHWTGFRLPVFLIKEK